MSRIKRLIAAAALLCACSARRPPITAPIEPQIYAGYAETDTERAELEAWIADAQGALGSKQFVENLRALAKAYPVVFLRDRTLGHVDDVERALEVRAPGLRYVHTPLLLGGDAHDFTASTGWTGDHPNDDGVQTASMTLGRGHLQRYRSGNLVERSCAINTLAHEISHTIVTHPTRIHYAIMDTGTGPPSDAQAVAASYLIGAVAQCTWLQQHARTDAAHLRTCVELFGTRNFNSLRCDRFPNGQPLGERPDLPAAAPPVWKKP